MTFINLYRDTYKLSSMCAVLEISKRTYYKYRNREDKDYYDYLIIKEIFEDSKGTYGSRRIREGLEAKYGVLFSRKKIQRIMKKYSLRPKYYKEPKNSMNRKRLEENVRPNLLKRDFEADRPNRKWCTDVTYLIFGNRRAYLSSIIDLYDMRIVAYVISRHNDNKLVMDTLNKELAERKDVSGCILHSDQGFQYTSNEYKTVCAGKGIIISMSAKGSPIDNSPIESWHSLLKKEVLYNNNISSLEEYIVLVEEWIDFYNTERIRLKKK